MRERRFKRVSMVMRLVEGLYDQGGALGIREFLQCSTLREIDVDKMSCPFSKGVFRLEEWWTSSTDDNTSIVVAAEGGANAAIPDSQSTNEDSHPHGISGLHGLVKQRDSISDDSSTNSSINSSGERRPQRGHTSTMETSTPVTR